jgi:hypothetical protein
LLKAIADNFEAVGVPRKQMRIFLVEPSAEKLGRRGRPVSVRGRYGFKIDV